MVSLGGVIVSLGCSNEITIEWIALTANTFLTVLQPEKSKIKELADLVSAESLRPGSWAAVFLLCPHRGK